MRSYLTNRRRFFEGISGLAVSVVVPKLPFETEQRSEKPAADRGFLIVNGWVLTREDLVGSEVTRDAV
jgi:hypothetical protein